MPSWSEALGPYTQERAGREEGNTWGDREEAEATAVAAGGARALPLPIPRWGWNSTRVQLLSSTQWLRYTSSWHRSRDFMSTGISTTLQVPSSPKILTSCNRRGSQ